MAEPFTGAAALAYIGAGLATVGAVKATSDMASGSSGFNVGRCHIQYPKQFPTEQFAHSGQVVGWDIIKFHADGTFWDNYLNVHCSGYVSNDNNPLQGRPGSENPNLPVNRFVVLNFDKSGTSENLSSGLLNVNVNAWGGDGQIAEGTADDPWVALRVEGRFDPVGGGDIQYSFKLGVNSHQQLHLSGETFTGTAGPGSGISLQGDHVLVKLVQHR